MEPFNFIQIREIYRAVSGFYNDYVITVCQEPNGSLYLKSPVSGIRWKILEDGEYKIVRGSVSSY